MYRNRRIRQLGLVLFQAMPLATVHKVATTLAAAGRSVEQRRRLTDRVPFLDLTAAERTDLEAAVIEIVSLTRRWPSTRIITEIIRP